MSKKKRRTFDDDFKIQLVEDIEAGRLTFSTALKQAGIYSGMLHRWRQKYKAGLLKRAASSADGTAPADNTALVTAQASAQAVEVLPAKRKYTKRAQVAALSPADAVLRHNEMAFYVDRSLRKLFAGIQAGTISWEEFTRGYVADLLTARNAAQGGK